MSRVFMCTSKFDFVHYPTKSMEHNTRQGYDPGLCPTSGILSVTHGCQNPLEAHSLLAR
jgi:hypothetical protein